MIYLFLSQRCLRFPRERLCVYLCFYLPGFPSQPRSILPTSEIRALYFHQTHLWYWWLSSYLCIDSPVSMHQHLLPVLALALYSTIEVLLGDGGRFQVWRHSQVLLSDVVFWGSVWTLTSKVVQFCEAPPCSSSKQPHVGSLHDTPAFPLSSTSPYLLSVSHHQHHHIHGEGSASASCSTITSPNHPPSVCISAVLIAPETQSNGQEMHAGVQLTGSPLSLSSLSWYPFHICPLSQALYGLLCSH